jgi:DNA polymerase III subunit beta
MKTAIVSRAALSAALAIVKDVVERRNTIPVLSNVRLAARDGQLVATGTDLDIETSVTLSGGAIDADFAVTVPAHNLADILKKAPAGDDLAIDAAMLDTSKPDDSSMTAGFDFGGLRINVQGIAASEFPHMAMSDEVVEFDIETAKLREGIEAVAFAISTEETRYYLNGIYMHVTDKGALRMVATDGHRLGRHDIEGNFPKIAGVIIPRKMMSHILKVTGKGAPESVRIIVNHAKVRVIVGNVTVVSKLIDGTFPDYTRVMPTSNGIVSTFDRKAMIEGIKAVSTVASERGRAVKWEAMDSGNCYKWRLSCSNPDIGNATYDVQGMIGEGAIHGLTVGMNITYALDLLNAMDSDSVTVRFNDSSSPMVWTAGDADATPATTYVLMPMRV